MTNPIAISPAIMVSRIALREGASLNTHLAKVAELRQHLALSQADEVQASAPGRGTAAHPVNGAEVDRLI